MNDLEWHLQPAYCSTVRHSLPFKVLLQTSIHRSLSSTGRGEQDGVVFHCAVTVILHTLERISRIFVAATSVMISCLIVWSMLTAW